MTSHKNTRQIRQTWWTLFAIIWLAFPLMIMGAWTTPEIETAGFYDIHYHNQKEEGQQHKTHIGQVEYGVSIQLNRSLTAEAAVAYAGEAPLMEVGAALINWKWTADKAQHKTGVKISAGQFDVPFGIDYRKIAVPDRRFLEPPLVSAQTLDWFNSVGVALNGRVGRLQPTVYAVQGMTENPAVGGRLGLALTHQINAGVSLHTEFAGSAGQNPVVVGLDAKGRFPAGTMTAECIGARGIFACEQVNFATRHAGYHVTFESEYIHIKKIPVALMVRESRWTALQGKSDLPETKISALVCGVRFKVSKHIQLTGVVTNQNYTRWTPSLQILGEF